MSSGRMWTVWDSCTSSLRAVGLACLIFTDASRNFCFRGKTRTPGLCEFFLGLPCWHELGGWCWCKGVMPQLEFLSLGNALPMGWSKLVQTLSWRDVLLSKQVCSLPCLPSGCSLYRNPGPHGLGLELRVSVLLLTRCAPRRPLENCLLIVLSNEYAHGLNCSYQNYFILSTNCGILEYIFLYLRQRQYWWLIV